MIIDFIADPGLARRYDILDAETGENLNHLRIFYADDQAAVLRRYLPAVPAPLQDESRCRAARPWIEVRRLIRIELKGRVDPLRMVPQQP